MRDWVRLGLAFSSPIFAGRTGTLIACFLVWSKALYTSDAIDVVRAARPNSIQSVEQINVVEEFAYHVHKMGTSLPSAFYAANNGIR